MKNSNNKKKNPKPNVKELRSTVCGRATDCPVSPWSHAALKRSLSVGRTEEKGEKLKLTDDLWWHQVGTRS